MSDKVKKGTANVTRYIMLRDSEAGTPETGYTITDLDLSYLRAGSDHSAKVDATALGSVDAAHSDNKMIEVDSTLFPGLYRVDWPDAAFVTGVSKVYLSVTGSGLDPAIEEVQLVNYDPDDAVRMGLTALPNAAADAAGGLPISDAGGLDLDTEIGLLVDHLHNKRTIEIGTPSYEYLWNDAGDTKVYKRELTDNDGNDITAATTGPINCGAWGAV